MQIFTIERKNLSKKDLSGGFSLVEILVALVILTVSTSILAPFVRISSRDRLDEALEKLESSLSFARDEASLRNVMTRVHFFPLKEPQEFSVEFGPSENFVIPLKAIEYNEADKDEENPQEDPLENKFRKVPELSDENKEIGGGIIFVGLGTSLYKSFIATSQSALYFYPNGEKDDGIIILGSDEELGILEVSAFKIAVEKRYVPLSEEYDNIQEAQLETAQKVYEEWLGKMKEGK